MSRLAIRNSVDLFFKSTNDVLRPFDQQRRVFGGTSVPGVQTVRFAAVATGEDYSRLPITLSDHKLQQELEHWIMEELGRTSPQAQDELHASWWRRIFGS